MNLSPPETLERIRLGNLLGEGADLQVFEATDADTGEPVVVKRAHPTLISRNIHRDIEDRTRLQAELRTGFNDIPNLARLHLLTAPDRFDWYFGDSCGHDYSVLVEKRAKGIPLFGSVSDMVRGHHVALPLNLFVLHPSKAHVSSGGGHPALSALAVIERFYQDGYLAQDLGPQNVFYSPGSAASTVIDLGTLRKPRAASPRHPPLDLNDVLLEVFRLYTSPESPPSEPGGFAQTSEVHLSGTLERRSETLSREYAKAGDRRSDPALKILSKVAQRRYTAPRQFIEDFRAYLAVSMSVGRDETTEEAWRQALKGLKAPYWKKFLFDTDGELR